MPPWDSPRDKEIERDAEKHDPNEKNVPNTRMRLVLCSDIGKEACCLNPIHPALFPACAHQQYASCIAALD